MSAGAGLSAGLLSCGVAFLGVLAAGGPICRWLQHAGVRQAISSDAPERHSAKAGTPTMGGLMMVPGIVAGWLCAALVVHEWHTGIAVALLTLALAFVGWVDDWLIVKRGRNLGLTARQKLVGQFVVTGLFVAWLAASSTSASRTTVAGYDLGFLYYPLAVVMLVGLSNATNLADGLDGLSAGMSVPVFLSLGMLAPGAAWFSFVMAGACAGLLWFNVHPALVFMGNTGALALGGAMGGIGLVGKMEVPLLIATGVFWAETISVMLQVAVFKWRKRTRGIEYARAHRLFRRAPLHHHLEEIGWPEPRIVGRLWLLSGACSLLAIIVGRTGWV